MLPEHVGIIRKYYQDDERQPRPQLDADQIEEFERLLQESFHKKTLLEVKIWNVGYFLRWGNM
jgi:hypothetical protein